MSFAHQASFAPEGQFHEPLQMIQWGGGYVLLDSLAMLVLLQPFLLQGSERRARLGTFAPLARRLLWPAQPAHLPQMREWRPVILVPKEECALEQQLFQSCVQIAATAQLAAQQGRLARQGHLGRSWVSQQRVNAHPVHLEATAHQVELVVPVPLGMCATLAAAHHPLERAHCRKGHRARRGTSAQVAPRFRSAAQMEQCALIREAHLRMIVDHVNQATSV